MCSVIVNDHLTINKQCTSIIRRCVESVFTRLINIQSCSESKCEEIVLLTGSEADAFKLTSCHWRQVVKVRQRIILSLVVFVSDTRRWRWHFLRCYLDSQGMSFRRYPILVQSIYPIETGNQYIEIIWQLHRVNTRRCFCKRQWYVALICCVVMSQCNQSHHSERLHTGVCR